MQKQLSYQAVMNRPQAIRDKLDILILAFCSWPRLLIEVFTRTSFGERYFSFSSSVMLTFVLAYYPFFRAMGLQFFSRYNYGYDEESGFGTILKDNIALYAYLIGFLYMAIQRRREVKRVAGEFDFSRYSLSTGDIRPALLDLIGKHMPANRRLVELLLEPGLFFFIGLILWVMGQSLGPVLIVSAIIYSLSYRAMYRIGDNFVLDQIDKLIINRNMVSSFAEEADSSETQGFYFYGRRPADPGFRRELADRMIDHNDTVEAL